MFDSKKMKDLKEQMKCLESHFSFFRDRVIELNAIVVKKDKEISELKGIIADNFIMKSKDDGNYKQI